MAKFIDFDDFLKFAKYLRYESRHFLDTRQRRFINAVLQTSKERSTDMPSGTILWRAAAGYTSNFSITPQDADFFACIQPHPKGRMKPLKGRAYEGRLNPKGIPCLYTATNAETAMTETRPWASTILSVAKLVLLKNVSLVDSSQTDLISPDWSQNIQENLSQHNWRLINDALSEPVNRNDDVADYAPTQVLAEAFRSAGFGGVIYNSRLGDGKNVALFDIDVAAVASRRLYRAHTVTVEYSPCNDEIVYEQKYKNAPGVFEPSPRSFINDDDDDIPF